MSRDWETQGRTPVRVRGGGERAAKTEADKSRYLSHSEKRPGETASERGQEMQRATETES